MADDNRSEPRLLSISEAASYLGCGQANVYGLIRSGELPYVRVGRRKGYRIDREDIDRFISDRKQQVRNAAPQVRPALRFALKHIRRS
ncbi:MAG: helix-turn-helix domain-containing protein, partial [Planctomycetota bacterium]|nr:helix-turn-helix domain-containing protein [Planctomycetota bacterium]MDA1177810.1 helix-turn-helix domain-containing protein [Planctomycetota bacterium]